jgi:site-specific DNA recombinase
MTINTQVQCNHPGPVQQGSDTPVRVNGQPERWLVAARLSRMSKQDRKRGDELLNSIQTQDRRAAAWAQAEGHVIVHVTRDKNVSGVVPPADRPELGPWLTDPVKRVQYDGIVAYTVDRLSRDYEDLPALRKWAETNRKKLYVIKERLAWPDARDGTLWAVAAERAAEEHQTIRSRITDQLRMLEDEGKFHGRPPFGYESTGSKYDHQLEPNETGRTYVPEIYRLVIKGWSLKRIADWLNAEGVRPMSGVWWPRNLAKMIRNPTYKGFRCTRETIPPDDVEARDGKIIRYRYGDRWTEHPRWVYGKVVHRCEALVDAATWKRANEALTNRPGRGRSSQDPAMLAGALWCPDCPDSPMYRIKTWTSRRGEPYLYYRCTGRGANRQSCGLMVRVEAVDAAVNQIIAEQFDSPVMEHQIIPGNEAEIENRLEEVRFEIRQLGAQNLADSEYDRELRRLRRKRDRVAATAIVEDRVELTDTGERYSGLWDGLSVAERGAWLAENGFRVTASKAKVTVTRGEKSAALDL